MHLGHDVYFYFTDTQSSMRKKRPAVINDVTGAQFSLFVFFRPSDRISGGANRPNGDQDVISKSSVQYSDDPALAAQGLPCWSDI